MIRYGSVCSGIEAATCAWESLGWKSSFYSEIDKFPRAVLQHHYPQIPLHGDFTTISEGEYDPIDLLVGGTPCQSFSIAGLRKGMDDARGNLALAFLQLARRTRPRWVVWENVPGVLSIDGGRAFGSVLGGLAELGYGWAYRVLDAQYFGVAQRRRRVFVVGCLGSGTSAAAVLFERESLRWDSPPIRVAREDIAPTIGSRPTGGGGLGTDAELDGALIARCVTTREGFRQDPTIETLLPSTFNWQSGGDVRLGFTENQVTAIQREQVPALLTIRHGCEGGGKGPLVSEDMSLSIGTKQSQTLIRPTFSTQERAVSENPNSGPDGAGWASDIGYTHEARNTPQAVAISLRGRDGGATAEMGGSVAAACRASQGGGDKPHVLTHSVRRLTPREVERLFGFPDDYTLIPYRGKLAADGPRYKALGNSMAVPVMAWIGQRVQMVNDIILDIAA